MYVFVKERLQENLLYLDYQIVKTGMLGATGNKGSVFIRFSYYDTAFAISCGHLSAGDKNNKSRVNELTYIVNKTLRNPLTKEVKIIT